MIDQHKLLVDVRHARQHVEYLQRNQLPEIYADILKRTYLTRRYHCCNDVFKAQS